MRKYSYHNTPIIKHKYTNGNYNVILFDDGSKVRYCKEDSFNPVFPESIDLKITNKCPYMCPYCHENSTPDGKEAKLLNDDGSFAFEFMNTLRPGSELAIGGGSVMSHSQLLPFLNKLYERGIVASITVSQKEFEDNIYTLRDFLDRGLINGLGISYKKQSTVLERFARDFDNVVLHVICGVVSEFDIHYIKNNFKKILILGYKDFRKGIEYHNNDVDHNVTALQKNMESLFWRMDVCSFDNLALKQLNIKEHVDDETYDEIYMGDDGQFTMYIDLPNNKFAKSSVYSEEKRLDITDNIDNMFNTVRSVMNE